MASKEAIKRSFLSMRCKSVQRQMKMKQSENKANTESGMETNRGTGEAPQRAETPWVLLQTVVSVMMVSTGARAVLNALQAVFYFIIK